MQYGISHLSVVPVREEAREESPMSSQVLYGELFKVLEKRKYWSRIRLDHDQHEGWITNHQYRDLSEEQYVELGEQATELSADLVAYIIEKETSLIPVVPGCQVSSAPFLNSWFEGGLMERKPGRQALVDTALLFLNSPQLKGGRTPFGIDDSGFTQMVYRLHGYPLRRSAPEQAAQGEPLSFIEESEPGDLAFFDNDEGLITHVGLILENHRIIHVSGKVRIDLIDHHGIFNPELNSHTHRLRVIKKVI